MGWSDDDEYFRLVVLNSQEMQGQVLAKEQIASTLRSLRKPEKAGFSRMVRESLIAVERHTLAGVYVDTLPGMTVDVGRLDRVAGRIIRGLFFHELGRRVPQSHLVQGRLQQRGLQEVLEPMGESRFPPLRRIQNGVFSYTWVHSTEDPDSTVWLTFLFDRLPLLGFTLLPETTSATEPD